MKKGERRRSRHRRIIDRAQAYHDMPRKRRHEEHENLERWLISYADFITLLFAFFVVMYAVSSINEGKYRVLSDTLVSAFNTQPKSLQPIQVGMDGMQGDPAAINKPERLSGGKPSVIEMLRQTAQSDALARIATDFESALAPLINEDLIKVTKNDLWVEIEINTSILFDSGSARLSAQSQPVLASIAGILQRYPNHLQVEGFTDNLPISTEVFPSNWELSAARAASVVHLFMTNGVQPERMAAIGYGEYRPVADNATADGRQQNRRVSVVVLADANARKALDIERNRATTGDNSVAESKP